MVKANAYGLGMAEVARALADAVPASALAGFGVAAVAEGEALRKAGWAGRILVLAPAPPDEFDRAASSELTLCISDLESAERWAAAAERANRFLAMHAEVDTGMGRAGFSWDRARDWGAALLRITVGRLAWEGVFTHFHSADEPDLASTRDQWERFTSALALLPGGAARSAARVLHTSNSAAAMRCGFPGDWVRPGIFLYGGRVGAEPPRPVFF